MAHFFMARFGRDLPAYDPPAGVTIRTFAPGDEETFLRCCAGGELGTESWSLDDVREKLLGKPGVAPERVFFAEDAQGRAGATATAVFEEGRGYVHMVAADPSFRGKGLGSQVVCALQAHLSAPRVCVYRARGENEAFYRALGFQQSASFVELRVLPEQPERLMRRLIE